MFTIDSVSGAVSATGLDYETSTSHSLIITASDAGTPPLMDTAMQPHNLSNGKREIVKHGI